MKISSEQLKSMLNRPNDLSVMSIDLAAELLRCRELLARVTRAANESIDDPKLLMIRAELVDNIKHYLTETE